MLWRRVSAGQPAIIGMCDEVCKVKEEQMQIVQVLLMLVFFSWLRLKVVTIIPHEDAECIAG